VRACANEIAGKGTSYGTTLAALGEIAGCGEDISACQSNMATENGSFRSEKM